MNANEIINEEMTLEEKLAAIDRLMNDEDLQIKINKAKGRPLDAPIDPSDATICDGCT